MSKTETTFLSADSKTQIHAWCWEPDASSRIRTQGIVQLVHGMTEYIDRYDAFARYLNKRGFVVVGHDNLGHGASVTDESQWGVYEVGMGSEQLIVDVNSLRKLTQEKYGASLPYFIFGHSMGSFIVRNYIARYGEGLAGATISGTGQMSDYVVEFGQRLAKYLAKRRGPAYKSNFINNMGVGGYNKKFEPARTAYDWLSKDEAIVDAYAADPRCTFMFSVSGYSELMGLVKGAVARESFQAAPKTLPILVIAGADDPVGDFSKAPRLVYAMYKDVGVRDATLTLYEGDRHEILNETDREQVYTDIARWIERHL